MCWKRRLRKTWWVRVSFEGFRPGRIFPRPGAAGKAHKETAADFQQRYANGVVRGRVAACGIDALVGGIATRVGGGGVSQVVRVRGTHPGNAGTLRPRAEELVQA